MHHNYSLAARRSGGPLLRHSRWPNLSATLAALVISFALVAFTFTASPGGGSTNMFAASIARADGGHGTGTRTATPIPTPTIERQPAVTDAHDETEMSATENIGDMQDTEDMEQMGAETAEESHSDEEGTADATKPPQSSTPQGAMDRNDEPEGKRSEEMDMSDEHATDISDDREEGTYEDPESNGSVEMDMNEEHEDVGVDEHEGNEGTGADDHDDAGSGADGSHKEYEGPSDLVRNITLGGFAGINGSVLLAAAILKKKNPKKEKGRETANSPAPLRALGGVTTVSTTSITGEVSTITISPEAEPAPLSAAAPKAIPVGDAITTINAVGSPAPKGDDLA